jgi:ceramide glucosyltransferase
MSGAAHLAALLATGIAAVGVLMATIGAIEVWRFMAQSAPPPRALPPISVLRPLCGEEPMLEEALETLCRQLYPTVQLVFGVQDPQDPAVQVVQRIKARFPNADITLVGDVQCHGSNRKISNLINMLPAAVHDVLVFSDSDLHVAPDYLARIVAALEVPRTGLVTTVCAGMPVVRGIAACLGASGISHSFVPGALISRSMGRQDCLGTTMALKRETLRAVGGLPALRDHLADDNVLGQLVLRHGLSIALVRTVPATAVAERSLGALWLHELRWARTIRALEPLLFALSIAQYPLFWAGVACALWPNAETAALFGGVWLARAGGVWAIDRVIGPTRRTSLASLALLPLRDLLSCALVGASYLGARVIWRGQIMHADSGAPAVEVV